MDKNKLLIKLKRYHYRQQKPISRQVEPAPISRFNFVVTNSFNSATANFNLQFSFNANCVQLQAGAVTEREVNYSIRQLGNRISNIAKAQRGLMKAAVKFMDTGQLSLLGGGDES